MNSYSLTTHTTRTGLTLTIVPRHAMLGVILDAKGQPTAVKHSSGRSYSDLKGIAQKDYQDIKPDLLHYELADGTLLHANPSLFIGSEMSCHHNSGETCYTHQVSRLKVVKMPEIDVSK